MAVTINTTSADNITPEELVEWAVENIDPTDDESMISASERLYALSNNRDFIVEKMRQQMLVLASGQGDHISSTQASFHAAKKGPKGEFVVRSGIWTPALTKDRRAQKVQDKALTFLTPHDHNFGLLTIGYHGPGYETIIYEYDRSTIAGRNDEPVSIKYLERTNLDKGKILYFRRCRDIHVQLHPAELSISLNLIGQSYDINSIPQYEFDVERQRVKGILHGASVMSSLVPFKIIDHLGGNQNVVSVVLDLAKAHESIHVRGAAYKTLANLNAKDFDKLVLPGLNDKSEFVRHIVKTLLTKVGG